MLTLNMVAVRQGKSVLRVGLRNGASHSFAASPARGLRKSFPQHPSNFLSSMCAKASGRQTRSNAQEIPRYEYLEMNLLSGKTNFEDFREHMDIFEDSGGLLALVERLPQMEETIEPENVVDTEHRISKYRTIIECMDPEEKQDVDMLLMGPSSKERRNRIAEEAGYPLGDIDNFLANFKASLMSFEENSATEPEDKVIPLVLAATSFWHPDKITEVPVKNEFEANKLRKKVKKASKKKNSPAKNKGFGSR